MAYLFIPPVVEEGPMGGNWLFSRYTRKQGVTVYLLNGEWYEDRYPAQDELDLADKIYLGGHEYYVTLAEKNALQAIGYVVRTV
jgi:hypothetical protein